MSMTLVAAIIIGLVSLSLVITLVIASLAAVVDHPPGDAMTELGHRAVAVVGLAGIAGVLALLALEAWT